MELMRAAQIVVLALASTVPGVTLAGPFGGPTDCVNDLLIAEKITDLGIAKVIADGKVHLQNDAAGCPALGTRCERKAYTVKGDVLVTAHRRGPWICVEYPNRIGGTEGWLRADQIADVPVSKSPEVKDWIGQWTRDSQASLSIRAKAQTLVVDGQAIWVGANPGQTNDGELNGEAQPSGASLKIAGDDPCEASMRLLGPYLIVADNHQCGGLNVSFSGIYRRSTSQHH